jgi:hypothetical protein
MTDAEEIPGGNALFEGVVATILEDDVQLEKQYAATLEISQRGQY